MTTPQLSPELSPSGFDQTPPTAEERKRLTKAEGEYYKKHFLKKVKAFPTVRKVFEVLKREGAMVGLATDCVQEELKVYRHLMNVDDLIDFIACGDDVKEGKPSPKLVRLAAERLGVAPARAIMTGDTPYDAEAALGAGVSALGVLTGGFSTTALKEAGCLAALNEVGEMHRFLASHTGETTLTPGFS